MKQALEALARLVLHPLLDIIGKSNHWYVSPSNALWLAPWGALPLPGGAYALEKHPITYLLSGRDLLSAASPIKPGRPLAVADPDYDLDPSAVPPAVRPFVPPPGFEGLRALSSAFQIPRVQPL